MLPKRYAGSIDTAKQFRVEDAPSHSSPIDTERGLGDTLGVGRLGSPCLRLASMVENFSEKVPDFLSPMPDHIIPALPFPVTVVIVCMYTLTFLVAVGGNLLVVSVVVTNKRMRSVSHMFLLNLAFSDLTKALLCNPFTFVANLLLNYWPFGSFMCPFVSYLQMMAVFLNAFTLVAICIDRHIAVVRPLRPRLSRRHVYYVLGVILTLSAVIPLPTAIVSRVVPLPIPASLNVSNASQVQGLCLEAWQTEAKYTYSLVVMCLQYFLPLFVLAFTSARISYTVWFKKTPGEANEGRDLRLATAKKRMVKMVMIVVVIYAICWLPLHVITLIGDRHRELYDLTYVRVLWLCSHWLAMSHSCYNPFVFFRMNDKFRRSLLNLVLHCSPPRAHAALELRLSRRHVDHDFTSSPECGRFRVQRHELTNSNGKS